MSRKFFLFRVEDATGISGTGFVAEGVQFASGKCAMEWMTPVKSIGMYDSAHQIDQIHGHGGKTQIIWDDLDYVDKNGDVWQQGDGYLYGVTRKLGGPWAMFDSTFPEEMAREGLVRPSTWVQSKRNQELADQAGFRHPPA